MSFSGRRFFPGSLCVANTHKLNTSACKARLGCGLCGCAAQPAPRIVKHARATQMGTHRARKAHTLTEPRKHTHTHSHALTARHHSHHTQREKQHYGWGGAFGAALIGSVVLPFVCGALLSLLLALFCVCFPSSVSVCAFLAL